MRRSFFFFFPAEAKWPWGSISLVFTPPNTPLLLYLLPLPIQLLNNHRSLCPPAPNLWSRTGHKQRGPIPIPGTAPSCLPEVRQLDGAVKNKPASQEPHESCSTIMASEDCCTKGKWLTAPGRGFPITAQIQASLWVSSDSVPWQFALTPSPILKEQGFIFFFHNPCALVKTTLICGWSECY